MNLSFEHLFDTSSSPNNHLHTSPTLSPSTYLGVRIMLMLKQRGYELMLPQRGAPRGCESDGKK